MKNYYAILGVAPDASLEEIKKAYRELVRRFHPDMGESADIERFLEVQEAFEVLSSKEKREAYDRRRQEVEQHRRQRWEGHVHEILSDFEFLRQRLFSHPISENIFSSRPRVPSNLAVEVVLTPEEARSRGHLTLDVPVFYPCPYCAGSGVDFPFHCIHCGGSGKLQRTFPVSIRIPEIQGSQQSFKLNMETFGISGELTIHFKISYY